MDTWHKKRMLLGEAEEKWRGEAGGVPPAPSPRGADHQKCSCPDLHTSTLPPPRGSPLFSPWKPADSPAGKEAKAGLTVAGGRAGTAGRGGRILGCLSSSVEAAVQGPGVAAGKGSTGDLSLGQLCEAQIHRAW